MGTEGGMTAKGYRVSFRGDKNVLKLANGCMTENILKKKIIE